MSSEMIAKQIAGDELPDYDAILTRYRDQAIHTDLMPVDTNELQRHQRNSLSQDRRRAQMAFLQKVWPEFWPEYPTLTAKEARRIMKAGIDDVEEVLEYVAHCAAYQHRGRDVVVGTDENGKERKSREKLDHPVGYVIKAIKNDLKRDRAEQLPSSVRIQEVKPAQARVIPEPRPPVPALSAPRSNDWLADDAALARSSGHRTDRTRHDDLAAYDSHLPDDDEPFNF